MPQGMQIWNAAGQLVLDLADRLSRHSGTASIPAGSTGSVNVPNAAQGSIWYAVLVNDGRTYCPIVTISGSTISWSPSSIATPAVDAIMLYGVY